jgi:HemK-like putative methylase
MPRLAPALLREARASHVLLPLLLRECRDLLSARNELRWLQEHAHESCGLPSSRLHIGTPLRKAESAAYSLIWKTLSHNVHRRAKGEPLQYILGTQPFGDLQILCREGVLIPRPETEAYTTRLGSILRRSYRRGRTTVFEGDTLRILDIGTGTGCIPLLLHSMLKPVGGNVGCKLQITSIDMSDEALALAQENLEYNIGENLLDLSAVSDITFRKANIFDLYDKLGAGSLEDARLGSKTFDVVISNPPYIAENDYRPGGTTTRSVRKFEPKLALVPEIKETAESPHEDRRIMEHNDAFYQPLLEIANKAKASIVILETGDDRQALRVHHMATSMYKNHIPPGTVGVWDNDASDLDIANPARRGARSVVIWREKAMQLRETEKGRIR